VAPPVARRGGRGVSAGQVGTHLFLGLFALLSLFPVLLVVSTAFRSVDDVRVDPFGLFSSFTLESLASAWTQGQFGDYFLDSVVLTVPSTLAVVALSTAAGYAFARFRFPGRDVLFGVVVVGLLVPFFTIMIPLYFQLRSVGLLDTLLGVVLVLTTSGLSFGTFFMRAFFIDLPIELEQAARVDGCGEWRIFISVMLPLVRSGMAALAIFTFLQNWNNFLVPLLYLPGGSYRPLTTGLYLFISGRTLDVGLLAAGTLITILPIVLLFVTTQRHLIRGFIAGSVKG
jgi:ABC-type glycerol-3-phosphate transport system permease component